MVVRQLCQLKLPKYILVVNDDLAVLDMEGVGCLQELVSYSYVVVYSRR